MKPLGFAIVGTGMVAGIHARAIAQTQGAALVGVVSRNPEGAQPFAMLHGIPVVVATVEEMAARSDIDAIIVTTPSGTHLEPALEAIAAGKHVVVEKPLEITPERADRIIDAADKAGVKLATIFQNRFGRGAERVKAAVEGGRLGRLVVCSASVKWYRSPDYYRTPWKGTWDLDGGGALMNQAIHGVDLLQWFAGMPAEVSAFIAHTIHRGIDADDTAVASLRFPDGALGTIEASTGVWPGWARRIELCGEKGSICLEDDRISRWDFLDTLPEDSDIRASIEDQSLGSGAGDPAAISTVGHQRQIEDFIAAVRDDRAAVVDGREGRKAVALVHAIYESARNGKPTAPEP